MYFIYGDKYKGNFKNGKREGEGEYHFNYGDKYKGNFCLVSEAARRNEKTFL